VIEQPQIYNTAVVLYKHPLTISIPAGEVQINHLKASMATKECYILNLLTGEWSGRNLLSMVMWHHVRTKSCGSHDWNLENNILVHHACPVSDLVETGHLFLPNYSFQQWFI